MDKIKDISVLLFAAGQYRPDAFAPTHAGLTACALSNASVNYHRSNLSLGAIVSRFQSRFGQKAKISFRSLAPEPPGQFSGQSMVWWSSHPPQKTFFDSFERAKKTSGRQLLAAMQRSEQLLEPFQQEITPAGQLFDVVLGKKTNFPNQMSQAVLKMVTSGTMEPATHCWRNSERARSSK